MKFVRFGKNVVNMDMVTSIDIGKYDAVCHFACASDNGYNTMTRDGVRLDGSDLIALEYWLTDNSENARAPMMVDDPTDHISTDACIANNI